MAFALVLGGSSAFGAETRSNQPYIDSIKKGMAEEGKPVSEPTRRGENVDPYIQSLKEKMPSPDEARQGSIIDEVRSSAPEGQESDRGSESSYTEEIRRKLDPEPSGGAIQAVKEGRSELKAKIDRNVRHGVSIRFGAAMSRELQAVSGSGNATFSSIYGSGWVPSLDLAYEFMPFHSEWFGNLSFVFGLGLSVNRGKGQFSVPNLMSPWGTPFGTESRTQLIFITIPLTAALKYRFNLFRYVLPYVQAGPTLVGMVESRNDQESGSRSNARGLTTSAGLNIPLNWIAPKASWNLYAEAGVKRYYLTIDYSRLFTFSGDVDVNISGLSLGFTYEY